MNLSEKRSFLSRAASEKQIPLRISKISAVLAMAVTAWCGSLRSAEIHEAAELGDLEKVKACLAQDPKQINSEDAKGRTVLARAILSGKKELVEFLLEKGATEDVFAAVSAGHADKVADLLKQDQKLVNAKDSGGKAPLHWAALYGQKKIVELLLAEKADVNLLDESGFTALHWAVMFDKSEVADVLLANQADTNIKVAKFGWTPLRLAVIHGHVATAEVLLKAGADPNVHDKDNIPLLQQAVISGKKAMVELLLAKKADVNAKDADGDTALDEAIEAGRKEIAEILRQHGGKQKP